MKSGRALLSALPFVFACGARSRLEPGTDVEPDATAVEDSGSGVADRGDADNALRDAPVMDDAPAEIGPAADTGSTAPNCDELVLNGDFSGGLVGFLSAYSYATLIDSEAQYTIGPNPSAASIYSWPSFGDPSTGTGAMLIANGATAPDTYVWSETVNALANKTYVFSAWAANVDPTADSVSSELASLTAIVAGKTLPPSTVPLIAGQWVELTGSWTAPASGPITLEIVDTNLAAHNNDFALADVSFQCE